MILPKPTPMDRNFGGLYQTHSKEYFIYLNPTCLGINKGNPLDLKKTLEEVIKLWIGLERQQRYSTNRGLNLSQLCGQQVFGWKFPKPRTDKSLLVE